MTGLLLVILLLLPVGTPREPSDLAVAAVLLLAVTLAVFAFWQGRRDRHAFEHRLAEHARNEARAELQLALARELHDKISHSLGYIVVHASVARHLRQKSTHELLADLAEVERAGRDGLADLRQLIAMLYDGDDSASSSDNEDLDATIDRHTRLGASIELIGQRPDSLPSEAKELAVILLRESLTNVVRHAGPSRVRVETTMTDCAVYLTISDEGPSSGWVARPGTGNGLRLLREQFEKAAGELTWQRVPRGGFSVSGRLPLHSSSSRSEQIR